MIEAAPKRMPKTGKTAPSNALPSKAASMGHPVQPGAPPPAHLLSHVLTSEELLSPKGESDADIGAEESLGVADVVEFIDDSENDNADVQDPRAVRFKNLQQFCDEDILKAWLISYFNLPADGHVMH